MFAPMPYGRPRIELNPILNSLHGFFGFAEIDYKVLDYHYHPVCTLQNPETGKLFLKCFSWFRSLASGFDGPSKCRGMFRQDSNLVEFASLV
jgi:hypothetical protein